jgi:hypothetical protein
VNYSIVGFVKVEKKHDVVSNNVQEQKASLLSLFIRIILIIIYIRNLRRVDAEDEHQSIKVDY